MFSHRSPVSPRRSRLSWCFQRRIIALQIGQGVLGLCHVPFLPWSSHHSLQFRLTIGPFGREDDPTEDWQEKHSSTNFVKVVSWIHRLYSLPSAFAERKMLGFHMAQDSDDQPSFSYCFYLGDSSSEVLWVIHQNDWMVSIDLKDVCLQVPIRWVFGFFGIWMIGQSWFPVIWRLFWQGIGPWCCARS